MQYYRYLEQMNNVGQVAQGYFHNTCVSIGKFNGVHIGHRLLLCKMQELSEIYGYQSVMLRLTFPNPKVLPHNNFNLSAMIYNEEETKQIVESLPYCPEIMLSVPMTEALFAMSAEQFVEDVLLRQLDAKCIVVGDDFCFGKQAKGNIDLLQNYATRGCFRLEVCPKKRYRGEPVSSTRIISYLRQGRYQEAEDMLGRRCNSTMIGGLNDESQS